MALVDTSVWIGHLRLGTVGFDMPLSEGQVLYHPFIIGELSCGNLKNRANILSLLHMLPVVRTAEDNEMLQFFEKILLIGKGLGYIGAHLLASSLLSHVPFWTLDKRLGDAAASLGIRYSFSANVL